MCWKAMDGNWDDDGNWVNQEDPGFKDEAKGDYTLRSDARVLKELKGFERIPFEKIGPKR